MPWALALVVSSVLLAAGAVVTVQQPSGEQVKAAAAQQAIMESREALEKLKKLTRELDDLDTKVSAAVSAIEAASNDAERAAAVARLEQLRREQTELKQRAAYSYVIAEGVRATHGCMDASTTGCL